MKTGLSILLTDNIINCYLNERENGETVHSVAGRCHSYRMEGEAQQQWNGGKM